ncbi:MAG: undecaprenyl-diphosphatase UppP [Candidatus Paceibacterota bacterium]
MPIDAAIILGFLQGITEFIPVSSSGHLILGREVINLSGTDSLAFDAVLQMATALAILTYFWGDLMAWIRGQRKTVANTNITLRWRTIGIIALATIPAVIAGLWLEPLMDTVFRNSQVVAFGLIVGAVLMIVAERVPERVKTKLNFKSGFLIGLYQCLALVPGMSRSGSTISGGLLAGLDRQTATSFSFLLGLPILLGGGGKKLYDLAASGSLDTLGLPLLVGSSVAFISGLAAMYVLMSFIKNHRLDWFSAYRILLAVAVLIIL